jgi:hypothetical protein
MLVHQQKGSDPEHGLVRRRRAHTHAHSLLCQQVLPPNLVRGSRCRVGTQKCHSRARQHVLRCTFSSLTPLVSPKTLLVYDMKLIMSCCCWGFIVTDFGNVENPPLINVHSHSKSLCARRPRQDRAGHYHALLDPCAGGRRHGACTI